MPRALPGGSAGGRDAHGLVPRRQRGGRRGNHGAPARVMGLRVFTSSACRRTSAMAKGRDPMTAERARQLGDGTSIPMLGLGVWQVRNGKAAVNAVRWAL